MSETERLTVGIDIGKDHLDVAIIPTGALHRITNDEEGHAQVVPLLNDAGANVGIARVVLEATGGTNVLPAWHSLMRDCQSWFSTRAKRGTSHAPVICSPRRIGLMR